MARIALLADNFKNRTAYLDFRGLPDNYMSDFSIMGLVVDHYPEAIKIISSAGYCVEYVSGGAEIGIENQHALLEIKTLLTANAIRCDFNDIADSFYQA